MGIRMEHSCVDCAIKKCNTGKGKYPEFCATEHMPEEVLADAMACYEEKENPEVSVAAAGVSTSIIVSTPECRRSWHLRKICI